MLISVAVILANGRMKIPVISSGETEIFINKNSPSVVVICNSRTSSATNVRTGIIYNAKNKGTTQKTEDIVWKSFECKNSPTDNQTRKRKPFERYVIDVINFFN